MNTNKTATVLLCLGVFINILNVSEEINELLSIRDYLLPLLMNGQVTIKD